MTHSKIVILMLGGARRVSMAELLKTSGHRIGYEVSIISYELEPQVPIAAAGKVVVGLKWSDPGVIDHIVKIVEENEVNIILPFVDGAISVAARCKERLPEVFVPVSDCAISELMFDKVIAAKAFADAELPIPATFNPKNPQFPVIAKPRCGSASKGIKVVYTGEELSKLENIDNYLLQKYIEHSEEYTVDCYISQTDQVLCIVPRLRIEVLGGEVTKTKTTRNETLIELSRKVIEKFHFRGPVTLQFIHDLDSDTYLLMEINPRLGGGVVCSIFAGAPISDYILAEKLNVPVRQCTDWSDKTLMTRYQKEVIFYGR